MTHVTHNPDPIPVSEANASQRRAGELKREFMKNAEGVKDEDRIIHELASDLSEETYLAALELMKEHFEDVQFYWNHNYNKAQYEFGVILSHSIWNAIEAKAKKQNEPNNP